ncbi:LutC/YkgG family protein [Pinibacter aurantiacus]|uniref:LUD domain-containing protein n=1 Tax=Pinibacter aurantiacus TaxID=2851599 RepID=A0A9E2S6V8_9BACT|nr:LUD domain-containing protein [Pinibacter aurantiacus]MBV4357668.1 LUD domain-containing protein [Pinibacter aurantiacus]
MNSRDKILSAIAANQPEKTELPDISGFKGAEEDLQSKYATVLTAIGGKIYFVKDENEIAATIATQFSQARRIVSLVDNLPIDNVETVISDPEIHNLKNVDLAIIKAKFGVAENGAVWITEKDVQPRVLPFICEHLAVVINEGTIFPTMHEAYQKIATLEEYGYGSFIAGPSKTADIEQSLVIGAHGPRSMSVFVKV